MKTHYLVYKFVGLSATNCGLIKEKVLVTSNWKKVTCLHCLDLKEKVKEKSVLREYFDYNGDSGSSFY